MNDEHSILPEEASASSGDVMNSTSSRAAGKGAEVPAASPDGSDPRDLRIQELEQELQASEDRCLRAMADFENFRRRAASSTVEASREEKGRLVLDLLEVTDNFERALEHMRKTVPPETQAGLEAIRNLLMDTLRRHGVEPVEAQGQIFDPNRHEVLDQVADPDRPDLTVTRVYQTGYTFGGRLLRPARVQVSRSE